MIKITPTISINNSEIREDFVRASGPGGQNVNKVATAVKLYFDVMNSPGLPNDVRERLVNLAGKRMNSQGILIIDARQFRSQEKNRRDALDRLKALIRKAAEKPLFRRKTKPGIASKQKRMENKRRRSMTKRMRGNVSKFDE